eukprot:CAMPEP_0181045978 /NCGR_PEP_ID=MMETSP1070-20121207/14102_1 /TAXON_ID=265543 /ORGANISM="Minutocellus polymorphus, Strain NH13" /LENGTH=43 /DNA_ID= /DNA_START= /DNA_END= /DNA_ORIENTATION=
MPPGEDTGAETAADGRAPPQLLPESTARDETAAGEAPAERRVR